MKAIYKFVAGSSRVTPVGLAAAIGVALLMRHDGTLAACGFFGTLLATLAVSVFEPPT